MLKNLLTRRTNILRACIWMKNNFTQLKSSRKYQFYCLFNVVLAKSLAATIRNKETLFFFIVCNFPEIQQQPPLHTNWLDSNTVEHSSSLYGQFVQHFFLLLEEWIVIVRSENKEDENILSIRSIPEIISTVESLDIVSESKIDDRN